MKISRDLLNQIKEALKKDDLISLVKTDDNQIVIIPGTPPNEHDAPYSDTLDDELC